MISYNRQTKLIKYLNDRLKTYNIYIKENIRFFQDHPIYQWNCEFLHLTLISGYLGKEYNKIYPIPKEKNFSITLMNKITNRIIYDIYKAEQISYKKRR